MQCERELPEAGRCISLAQASSLLGRRRSELVAAAVQLSCVAHAGGHMGRSRQASRLAPACRAYFDPPVEPRIQLGGRARQSTPPGGASRVSSRTQTSTTRCAAAGRRGQVLGSRGVSGRAATGTPSGRPPRARVGPRPHARP